MSFFAAATSDCLFISDPSTLKRAPSSILPCLDLLETPSASSWSSDNAFLYISSPHTIHRYEQSTNTIKDIYSHESNTISCLIARDRSSVFFSSGDKIYTLEYEPDTQILQTFDSHKAPITSLSLSNDGSLLASTSLAALHVHNISLGSHTIIRGVPNHEIKSCSFHPHSRTRLLVASGKQILVYDTTRPSAPLKTITLSESGSGHITALASSPFSKTLIAVAISTGFVGLVDLEKEKALFRTLNVKVPLSTVGFSPEGAAIYLGTETGKLLVIDLRGLDKPPKSIMLSETGNRVETISVQKRIKPGEVPVKTAPPVPVNASATVTRKPSVTDPTVPTRPTRSASNIALQNLKSSAKVGASPARRAVKSASAAASPTTITNRKLSFTLKEGLNKSPLKLSSKTKKILSPVRDPHGNSSSIGEFSVHLEELPNLKGVKSITTPVKNTSSSRTRPSPSPGISASSATKSSLARTAAAAASREKPRRARTLPTSTSTSAPTTRKSSAQIASSTSVGDHLNVPHASPRHKPRTASSATHTQQQETEATSPLSKNKKISVKSATSTRKASPPRASSSASRPSSSVSRRSPKIREQSPVRIRPTAPPPVPKVTSNESEPPSPDLPDMHTEPITPLPAQKLQKKSTMGVLGLGTPELELWIHAGQHIDKEIKPRRPDMKGKDRTVGFQANEDEEVESDEGQEIVLEHKRELSIQISPLRATHGVSNSESGSTDSWSTSPLAANQPTVGGGGGGGGSSAHELLKTIVLDVMYDFQRDTKAEMMGLHLDLLRMGRGWKTELRTLMDEYVGDLRDLREENQRLRLENERLRRGLY